VIDDAGNVYVTGESKGTRSDQDTDYATVKYDSSGIEQWVQRYNGSANHVDHADRLVVDIAGNAYVSGHLIGMGGPNDSGYATVKYDKAGSELWAVLYEGEGSIAGMAIDDEGNVYAVGSGSGADGGSTTLKYDPSGNLLWATKAKYETGIAHAVAMDDQDNVYVAGENCSIIKYDPEGNEVWSVYYDGTPDIGYLWGIALDNSGNVYVAGTWNLGDTVTLSGGDWFYSHHSYYVAKYMQQK
jgi:hypothetical protein